MNNEGKPVLGKTALLFRFEMNVDDMTFVEERFECLVVGMEDRPPLGQDADDIVVAYTAILHRNAGASRIPDSTCEVIDYAKACELLVTFAGEDEEAMERLNALFERY